MNEFCVERGVNFLVVLIPTDIMVYSEYLTKESVKDRNLFNNVVHSEDLLKRAVLEMLIDKRIAHVDVLDSLKAHTSDVIYPKYEDGHPSPLGYSIIAKAVAAGIERNGMLEIN
jgi:lysophospholipase L1-like esterase